MSDLFVGYNWPVQPDLWRFVRRAALGLGVGVVGLSGALAVGHRPLEGGTFEFGHVTEHQGRLVGHPVPMLRRVDGSWPLLVASGKHGAEASVRGLDGQDVTLRATRISRNGFEMLEIAGPLTARKDKGRRTTDQGQRTKDEGQETKGVTLTGEIVDSKCFLGVMVPGEGTTHRGCAALCLRGGIPAALHVRQADGSSVLYLITGSAATRERSVMWAGETVQMEGTVTLQGGWQVLTTEPESWRRLER
jgi:hypothetical protein